MISFKLPRWINAQPSLGTTGPDLSPQNLRDWVCRVMTRRGLDERKRTGPTVPLKVTLFSPWEMAASPPPLGISSSLSFNLTYWCQKLMASLQVHVKENELAFSLSSCHWRDHSINTDEKIFKYFLSIGVGGGFNFSFSNIPNPFSSVSSNSNASHSVMSDSLRPRGLQPTRLLPPSMGFSRQEYWTGVPLPSRSPVQTSLFSYQTPISKCAWDRHRSNGLRDHRGTPPARPVAISYSYPSFWTSFHISL